MKTVVITGVSRGIGKALAQKFLGEGYKVIGTSTDGTTDISNSNLEMVMLDLANAESIEKAVVEIQGKADTIDILINNAGVAEDEQLGRTDLEALRKTMEVNVFGTIGFTEQLVHKITSGGQIINLGSIMGQLDGTPQDELDWPAYRISKTAVHMYTKVLASRLNKRGVTVSAVHPGWVKTDMGGEGATREPENAANEIYKLATTPHETGLFWYDNKVTAW